MGVGGSSLKATGKMSGSKDTCRFIPHKTSRYWWLGLHGLTNSSVSVDLFTLSFALAPMSPADSRILSAFLLETVVWL